MQLIHSKDAEYASGRYAQVAYKAYFDSMSHSSHIELLQDALGKPALHASERTTASRFASLKALDLAGQLEDDGISLNSRLAVSIMAAGDRCQHQDPQWFLGSFSDRIYVGIMHGHRTDDIVDA